MTKSLEDDMQRIAASIHYQQNSQQQETPEILEQETQSEETIHIHYFPDAIVILKEEDQTQVVDSIPVLPQKTSMMPAYAICCCYILLPFSYSNVSELTLKWSVLPASSSIAIAREPLDRPSRFGLTSTPQAFYVRREPLSRTTSFTREAGEAVLLRTTANSRPRSNPYP
jgi:hypothetical protein